MCVTFFSLKPQSGKQKNIQFIIAFNRDQQSKRQTNVLQPLKQDPNIYAGRDAISGGTWLGVNVKTGIMIFLTNYDLEVMRYGKSRGQLLMSFLNTGNYQNLSVEQTKKKIYQKLVQVLKERKSYCACNIVIYHPQSESLFYICTEVDMKQPRLLSEGQDIGLCNGFLDDVWPKTKYGLSNFEKITKNLQKYENNSQIFRDLSLIMTDNKAFDSDPQREASIFIQPFYSKQEKAERKTKCTFYAIVQKSQNGFEIHMKEISYDQKQQQINVQYVQPFGKSNNN